MASAALRSPAHPEEAANPDGDSARRAGESRRGGSHHASAEDAARRALLAARPSVEEILSLWPTARRERIVLWVKVDEAGDVVIVAHPRDQPIEGVVEAVSRDVRRIQDDVPIVLDLPERGTVVFPLQTLRRRR